MKYISPLHIRFHCVLLLKQKGKCVTLLGVQLYSSWCHSTGYDSSHFGHPNIQSYYGADFSSFFKAYGSGSSSFQFPSFSTDNFFGWVTVFNAPSQFHTFSASNFFEWLIVFDARSYFLVLWYYFLWLEQDCGINAKFNWLLVILVSLRRLNSCVDYGDLLFQNVRNGVKSIFLITHIELIRKYYWLCFSKILLLLYLETSYFAGWSVKGRDYMGKLDVEEMIILKCNMKVWCECLWTR